MSDYLYFSCRDSKLKNLNEFSVLSFENILAQQRTFYKFSLMNYHGYRNPDIQKINYFSPPFRHFKNTNKQNKIWKILSEFINLIYITLTKNLILILFQKILRKPLVKQRNSQLPTHFPRRIDNKALDLRERIFIIFFQALKSKDIIFKITITNFNYEQKNSIWLS